jgi:hypothetical protein
LTAALVLAGRGVLVVVVFSFDRYHFDAMMRSRHRLLEKHRDDRRAIALDGSDKSKIKNRQSGRRPQSQELHTVQ